MTDFIIEVVTEGPQGPQGEKGDPGSPPVTVETAVDYTADIEDNHIVGTASPITLTFPLIASAFQSVEFINDSGGDITLNGNGEAVPNGTLLSNIQAREFLPTSNGWKEV